MDNHERLRGCERDQSASAELFLLLATTSTRAREIILPHGLFYRFKIWFPPMEFSRRDTAKSTTSVQSAKIKRTSTTATQASASAPARQPQIVDDRYLDEERLKAYLEEHFPDQWKIQVTKAQHTAVADQH